MNYLLDTNVVSEWVKPRPNESLLRWVAGTPEDSLFLSVLTFAELHRGVEMLAMGARRKRLDEWVRKDLAERFDGRVLGVTLQVAESWGRILAQCEARGKRMGAMDGFMAATAEAEGMTLVTRNTKDYARSGVKLLCPWE